LIQKARIVSLSIRNYSFNFYCPMCGTKIMGEDASPCPHLLFIFDLSEFFEDFPKSLLEYNTMYLRDDLKEALKNIEVEKVFSEEELDISEVLQRLLEILEPKLPCNTVVFVLTGYGHACGPVEYTAALGIEFEEHPKQK